MFNLLFSSVISSEGGLQTAVLAAQGAHQASHKAAGHPVHRGTFRGVTSPAAKHEAQILSAAAAPGHEISPGVSLYGRSLMGTGAVPADALSAPGSRSAVAVRVVFRNKNLQINVLAP